MTARILAYIAAAVVALVMIDSCADKRAALAVADLHRAKSEADSVALVLSKERGDSLALVVRRDSVALDSARAAEAEERARRERAQRRSAELSDSLENVVRPQIPDSALAAFDELVASKDAEIAQRDSTISAQDRLLRQSESTILLLRARVGGLEEIVADHEALDRSRVLEIEALRDAVGGASWLEKLGWAAGGVGVGALAVVVFGG